MTGTAGRCHCGAVAIRLPSAPDWVGSCNCSLCRKLGWLVAYYPAGAATVRGPTRAYVWGDRMLATHHCKTCGCVTHWLPIVPGIDRMGVNARLIDGFDEARVEVRRFDNADR